MKTDAKQYTKILLIGYAAWILLFQIVGRFAATLPTFCPITPLDRIIPLVPEFIWIYQFCYVFPLLPLLVVKDYHRLNIAILAAIFANLTAFSIYLLFPIAFPHPELGQSVSERLLAFEYAADFQPGANKLPSMHVTFAWLIFLACRKQKLKRTGEIAIGSIAVGITVSTLLVKQHIVLDVIFGLIWAIGSWQLAKAMYPRFIRGAAEPRLALRKAFRSGLPAQCLWMLLPVAFWGAGHGMEYVFTVDWPVQNWSTIAGAATLGSGAILMSIALILLPRRSPADLRTLFMAAYALLWVGYSTWMHSFWMLALGLAALATTRSQYQANPPVVEPMGSDISETLNSQ
jgi:membrane-associated phospholipid phosphatase